MIYRRCKCVI